MRFCPFCAQDNPDDARECGHCGKRLPQPRTAPPRTVSAPPVEKPRGPPRAAPRSRPLEGPPLKDETPEPLPQVATQVTAAPPSATVAASSSFAPPTQVSDPPSEMAPEPEAKDPPTQSVTVPVSRARVSTKETTLPAVAAPPLTPPAPPQPKRAGAGASTILGMPAAVPPPAQGSPVKGTPAKGTPAKGPLPSQTTQMGLGAAPAGPAADPDSSRRSTKPLSVDAVKQAAATQGAKNGTPAHGVGFAATMLKSTAEREALRAEANIARPPGLEEPGDNTKTTPRPRVSEDSLDGDTRDDVPLPPSPRPQPVLPTAPLQHQEPTPTPAIPTLAVPPMPPVPKSGSVIEAVLYLPPLVKAIWARQKAQATIRSLLHGDQKLLDTVLRDLGRAARESALELPALADEMRRVKAEEQRRARAEEQMRELDGKMEEERARWIADEQARNQELLEREGEIKGAEEELKKRGDERRIHEAERSRIDGQIRAAEKRAAQADARAQKADLTPPEKGGGPHTAANARAEADAARKEATALIGPRDEARARVEALDEPIAALTKQVVDGRAALGLKRKELAEGQAAHKRSLAALDADKRRAEAERDGAEREMSQRFVAAGTLLNLNRVESAAFTPLYQRIDELKNGVNAREAAIVRLESERRGYDRPTVQKGLIVVGGAFGALVLLMIVLMVLFARHG